MKKLTMAIIIACTTMVLANAQNSIGFNLGLSSYEGDLHCFEEPDMNVLNSAGFSFGLDLRKELSSLFATRIAYQFAHFQGDDNNFDTSTGHPGRNFNFQNNLHELTLRLDLEPFQQKVVSPYISAGLGLAFNNPNTFFDFENKSQSLQNLIEADQEGLNRFIFAIPVSAGLNFKITDKIKLGTDFGLRLPMSDYLDGVSETANSNFNDYLGTALVTLHYAISPVSKSKNIKKSFNSDQNISEQTEKMQEKPAESGEIMIEKQEDVIAIEQRAAIEKEKQELEAQRILLENERKALEQEKAKLAELQMDTDGDGFLDKVDDCPLVYSTTNNGCKPTNVISDINCEADFGTKIINFQTSFSELSNVDKEKLNYAISVLAGCPSLTLTVEGHTDSRGSEMVNQALSERRARSVKSYIQSRGISSSRIKIFGYGENQPIASNETVEGRAQNRRVTISFR